MMDMVRNANNPDAMLAILAQTNPQLKQIMDFIQQAGGSPEKAFYALCQQRGVNPQDIIDGLK